MSLLMKFCAMIPPRRRFRLVACIVVIFITVVLLMLSINYSTKTFKREIVIDDIFYVSSNVPRAWTKRDFLVVFGIPSVDIDGRRVRRDLQRSTCWRFDGVATRVNNFTGAMLVLYVLARHSSHGHEYSAALQEEAALWHDIVALPMNEGRVTTKKKIGGLGFWGIEAEIGMSRKTYLWFEFALRVFPSVPYIGKGDDDMFLRVPQYLTDLRALPRRGVYWGLLHFEHRKVVNETIKVEFISGPCSVLARDVAQQVLSYQPLQQLVHLPYSKERKAEFLALDMNHEDLMVGRVLCELKKRNLLSVSLLYVCERPCSFYNIPGYQPLKEIKQSYIMVHHLSENEYGMLMEHFGNDTGSRARKREYAGKDKIWLSCGV